jgi:uncharacterized repeat protein (TIGR03803 family)
VRSNLLCPLKIIEFAKSATFLSRLASCGFVKVLSSVERFRGGRPFLRNERLEGPQMSDHGIRAVRFVAGSEIRMTEEFSLILILGFVLFVAVDNGIGQTLTTLHTFTGPDGYAPVAGLVKDSEGNYYGTTSHGGVFGAGTVFKLDTNNMETVLFSFNVASESGVTAPLLMDSVNNLYGAADAAPAYYGSVFEITSLGVESFLYVFGSEGDGFYPFGGLAFDSRGNLYGTTSYGGGTSCGCGTIFELTPTGKVLLHSFTGAPSDGNYPLARLVLNSVGVFVGTTLYGGSLDLGTVFTVDSAGNETVIHNFSGPDGEGPAAGLIQDDAGNLYGTTLGGGQMNTGTVFKMAPSGGSYSNSVLYSFSGGTDGAEPQGGLVMDSRGNLYGTTRWGGIFNSGTIYQLVKQKDYYVESVLYNFTGGADGGYPTSDLVVDTAGNLYGTTQRGGDPTCRCGTVFKLNLAGKGVDISRASGDVTDQQWQNMVSTGVRFAVVQGWGGLTENPWASQQLIGDGSNTTGAQNNGLLTGAYTLLNYFSDGGSGSGQVEEAVFAVGPGLTKLKLMAVDVEPCCGEFVNWKASHLYKPGELIEDPATHIQNVISVKDGAKSGRSGKNQPSWNDSGGTTDDGDLSWIDTGRTVIDQPARIARICEAVAAIAGNLRGVDAAIYTSRGSWSNITGGAANGKPCPAPNESIILTNIPLWDVQSGHFLSSDGSQHCGDGIAQLNSGFKKYAPAGWRKRLGKQYDLGPTKPPKGNDPCSGNAEFGISVYDVDLDFFDASLFQ